MKFLYITVIGILLVSCTAHSTRHNFSFANKLAQAGLWNEALYRWTLALQAEGESASVHNNLAVALEQLGRFEDAEKEYKKALELDPKNQAIKSNYDLFQKSWQKRQK